MRRATVFLRAAAFVLTALSAVFAQSQAPGELAGLSRRNAAIVARAASQDRFERPGFVLFIDKGLLSGAEGERWAGNLERALDSASKLLARRPRTPETGGAKPAFYLTVGVISSVQGARVFLNSGRVLGRPAIAIHEIVHLLLWSDPASPRMLANSDRAHFVSAGMWLSEGFASYVAHLIAPRLGFGPGDAFIEGDNSTVDIEASRWLEEPRGLAVLPYVGAGGIPPRLFSDRTNVAAPFYVLSHSFTKFLAGKSSLGKLVQLHEQHFNGTNAIGDDVFAVTGIDLTVARAEWVNSIRKQ